MKAILAQLHSLPSYAYLSEILGTDRRRTAIELVVTSLCLEAVKASKGETENEVSKLSVVTENAE